MSAADTLAEVAEDLRKEAALYRRHDGQEFAAGVEYSATVVEAELARLVPLTRAGLEVAA